MPQFVEHRAHPVFVGHNVGQDPDVALAINVGAECMRTFTRLFVEIAAGDHVINRQTHARVVILGQFQDVHPGVYRVQVGPENSRRFLEEGVVIMPGPQLIHGDAAMLRQSGVDF